MNGTNHIQRILFLSIFFVAGLYAQSFNFKNITTEDGLPSSECYKIIQDKKGYMWIATDAGLCKYNGKEFRIFTTNDGLPTNTMFEILEDRKGWIWGACFHGGIFYVKNDTIHTINANSQLNEWGNTYKEIIKKMKMDSLNVLHVGTTKNYYQIYPDNNYGRIQIYSKVDTSRTLLRIFDNEVFFATVIGKLNNASENQHVIEMGDRSYTIYPVSTGRQISPGYYAARFPNGHISITFANLLYEYDFEKLTCTQLDENIIYHYVDRSNNLWIGVYNEGFYMYPGCDLSKPPVRGLKGNTVSGFYQDKDGGIWVTTLNKGLYYNPNIGIGTFDDLPKSNIPAVGVHNDQLYIGSADHKVWRLNGDKPEFLFDLYQPVPSERIFIEQAHGNLYKTGGLSAKFNDKGEYKLISSDSLDMAIPLFHILQIEDMMWGINHERLFTIVNDDVVQEYFLPSRGSTMFHTRRNEFLVGCINGLYRFSNGQFVKMSISQKQENIRIACITEDQDGNLIVASKSHGVFIRLNNRWINLNESHGIASNFCNHVFCSEDGSYYISTNKGLTIIKRDAKIAIQNINTSNGIISNEINMVTEWQNKIYIATEGGLCYYHKQYPVFNDSPPQLIFTNLSLSGVPIRGNSKFSYDQNDLFFSCDVLSYQRPKDNRIKHQLFPVDQQPKYASVSEVNYDNLPPGDYHLVVWGVNNNGVESVPQSFQFIIRKPFWSTWWFITISALALIGVTYMMVRERINYIRKREEEKTLLKEKIVEYHYTALRAQMNPHFIFNVINSIQLYVLNNQPREAYNYLSKFSKLIRKVLQNSKEKLISLSDEMETLRLYMELEQIRLEGSVEFQVKIDPSIDQDITMVPSMIIQPLLENAIWHGIVPLKGSRKGIVSLHISSYHQMFRIQIRDNGNGIDVDKAAEEKGSFGLNLIKDRLALLSDQTQIEIANLMDEQNNIQGVEVTILMPFIKK